MPLPHSQTQLGNASPQALLDVNFGDRGQDIFRFNH